MTNRMQIMVCLDGDVIIEQEVAIISGLAVAEQSLILAQARHMRNHRRRAAKTTVEMMNECGESGGMSMRLDELVTSFMAKRRSSMTAMMEIGDDGSDMCIENSND